MGGLGVVAGPSPDLRSPAIFSFLLHLMHYPSLQCDLSGYNRAIKLLSFQRM